MPTNHQVVAALPTLTGSVKSLLRNLLVGRYPYSVATAAEVQDLVATDPDTGVTIRSIDLNGRLYRYDSTDTTSVHDGISVLVSYDNRRYKLDGADPLFYSVIDRTLTAPPGSPAIGDTHLVATAATGAWATHDDKIAIYTARGWEFITPRTGQLVYVQAEDAYVHSDNYGDWIVGFGTQSLPANSVPPSALIGKPIRWEVENQTTNAPPGTAALGVQYIIGSAPTGAWSGNAGKIAICEVVNAFTIYTPRTGELAYDKNLAKEVRYSSSAWVAGADALVLIERKVISAAAATLNFTTGFDDTYDFFELEFCGKVTTDSTCPLLRVGTGAGPTFQVNGYKWSSSGYANGVISGDFGSTSDSSIGLYPSSIGAGNRQGGAAGENFRLTLRFQNPENSDILVIGFNYEGLEAGGGQPVSFRGVGSYVTAAPVTGLQFLMNSSTYASGAGELRGKRKS